MALSRKRRNELTKLKSQAADLWDEHKQLLDHAGRVASEARRQASHYAREEVSPRIRDKYDDTLGPVVSSVQSAANHTRHRITDEVIPGMTSAIGIALAAIEVAKNQQLRDAVDRATKIGSTIGNRVGNRVGTRVGIIQPKPKAGPGRYLLIGVSVVAFAVVAYAAWQTLRADDDLWVEEDELEKPPTDKG